MFKVIPPHGISLSWSELRAIIETIRNGEVVMGSRTKEFEDEFAEYLGIKYAISTASARAGFYLVLKALDLGEGDEIIFPSYTFFAFPKIAELCGLEPVYVEINEDTYNIDSSLIKKKITKKTKVIVAIHIFGQACDMNPILEIARNHNLKIIEDCAHSCGTEYKGKKVGTLGDVGIFSFAMGKNMTCLGGGMVVTSDPIIANKAREMRNRNGYMGRLSIATSFVWGLFNWLCTLRPIYTTIVYPIRYVLNFFYPEIVSQLYMEEKEAAEAFIHRQPMRMSNLQATIGLAQLRRLDCLNQRRIDNARILNAQLKLLRKVKVSRIISDVKHTYNCYPLEINDAHSFRRRLFLKGVDTREDYNSSYSDDGSFKELPKRVLYLPNYPSLREEDMSYISTRIRECIEEGNG